MEGRKIPLLLSVLRWCPKSQHRKAFADTALKDHCAEKPTKTTVLHPVTQQNWELDLLSRQARENRLGRRTGDLPNIPEAASAGAGISSQPSQLLPSQTSATLFLSCSVLLLSTQLSILNRLPTVPFRQLSGLDECLHRMGCPPSALSLCVLLTLISHWSKRRKSKTDSSMAAAQELACPSIQEAVFSPISSLH